MIKLLLVTLFCVTVIAQSPQDVINAGAGAVEGAIKAGANMLSNLGGMARREAQHPPRGSPPMRPPERPQNA